ncbi:hypothetical protein WN51_04079 [Melipona quadrifasciata]|uniref:Uncharacterized protein n=1 Tax=Melipona quadrifasciata TaxID=166423 RepID=A0A0M8ZSA1_9HYME|nr:hypothetical protein WN51_04079 [Melipona quadrifasciata]
MELRNNKNFSHVEFKANPRLNPTKYGSNSKLIYLVSNFIPNVKIIHRVADVSTAQILSFSKTSATTAMDNIIPTSSEEGESDELLYTRCYLANSKSDVQNYELIILAILTVLITALTSLVIVANYANYYYANVAGQVGAEGASEFSVDSRADYRLKRGDKDVIERTFTSCSASGGSKRPPMQKLRNQDNAKLFLKQRTLIVLLRNFTEQLEDDYTEKFQEKFSVLHVLILELQFRNRRLVEKLWRKLTKIIIIRKFGDFVKVGIEWIIKKGTTGNCKLFLQLTVRASGYGETIAEKFERKEAWKLGNLRDRNSKNFGNTRHREISSLFGNNQSLKQQRAIFSVSKKHPPLHSPSEGNRCEIVSREKIKMSRDLVCDQEKMIIKRCLTTQGRCE